MMQALRHILKTITTDDDQNSAIGMVRVAWVCGGIVGLLGGLAMIVTYLATIVSLKTVTDHSNFGIGFAAWLGGFGAYVSAGAGALWAQAKADQVGAPTVVTETINPGPPVEKTTTVEQGEKDKQ
jgi:hypothetical protein